MPRTPNRATGREPAKAVPHPRVPTRTHVTLIGTFGGLPQPCHVRDIAEAVGTGVWGVGIAMKFLVHCRLAQHVAGTRGTYRATAKGQAVARAWSAGEEEGKQALHQALAGVWFVRTTQERLRDGPGMRTGLRLKFLQQVRTPGHEAGVDRLLDLLVATGFLVEEPDGYVRWYEHAPTDPVGGATAETRLNSPSPLVDKEVEPDEVEPASSAATIRPHQDKPRQPSAVEPETAGLDRSPTAADHAAATAETAAATVPSPRLPDSGPPHPAPLPAGTADELLTREFGMSDILHLTTEETTALHDHLTGLLGILSAMHERSRRHGEHLNAALLTPWTPGAIAASSREEWLNTHYLVRQLAAAEPFRRQATNT